MGKYVYILMKVIVFSVLFYVYYHLQKKGSVLNDVKQTDGGAAPFSGVHRGSRGFIAV
jgi:heme/copper-type cytochrome/quinol oxidase subunit 3